MALPPCHVMSQFYVNTNNELSCMLFQKSGDVGLGVPFNIASYGILTHILAKHCNLDAVKLIHLLVMHMLLKIHKPLQEQILRPTYDMPTIDINQRTNIDDYEFSDIKIKNYKYHPTIKMNMIA